MKKFTIYIDAGKVDPLVSVWDGSDIEDVREQVRDYIDNLRTRYGVEWRLMRIEVKDEIAP